MRKIKAFALVLNLLFWRRVHRYLCVPPFGGDHAAYRAIARRGRGGGGPPGRPLLHFEHF